MQRALAVVIAVLLAAGAVAVVAERQRKPAPAQSFQTLPASPGPDPTEVVLRPDQSRITGTIVTATFDGATLAPLNLPLTVTAGVRGSTNARITGARANGQTVTITWDGGQPLPISGTGSLDVSGGHLDVRADGLTWLLDGAPRALSRGHYELGATVAVGTSGLATPVDATAFDATPQCALTTTDGATLHVAPRSVHLEGPGFLVVHGQLQVETAAGKRVATQVQFGQGSFVADLTPVAGGWTAQILVQGPLR